MQTQNKKGWGVLLYYHHMALCRRIGPRGGWRGWPQSFNHKNWRRSVKRCVCAMQAYLASKTCVFSRWEAYGRGFGLAPSDDSSLVSVGLDLQRICMAYLHVGDFRNFHISNRGV